MSHSTNNFQTSTEQYQAYLVRFWRTDESGQWYAYARNVQTGDTHHFFSIEQCIAFLQQAYNV